MDKENPAGPLFRLRLVRCARFPVRVAAGSIKPPPLALGGTAIELTVMGCTAVAPDEGNIGGVPTAVALLRTLFEDHEVDPDHQSCVFFNGCTIGTCSVPHDFSVTHRGGAVVLSDFTFPQFRDLGAVTVPLPLYAREVVAFARQALAQPDPPGLATWAQDLRRDQRQQLAALLGLAEEFVAAGCGPRAAFAGRFYALHGHRKRPLELQILSLVQVGGAGPSPTPWVVRCRVVFGPIRLHELIPLRVGASGPVAIGQPIQFGPEGVTLALMGAPPHSLRPGAVLKGLQLFYP